MLLIRTLAIILCTIAFIGCAKEQNKPAQQLPPKGEDTQEFAPISQQVNIGSPAPDFTMNDINGRPFTLSSLKGKVVMIDFWATWCPPCVRSIPEAKNIWNTFKKQDFALLGVSLDKNLDTWKNYVTEQQMSWIQVADGNFWDNKAAVLYGIGSIPSVWILDKEGNVVLKDVNPLSEGDVIRAKITELLNKK
jgi:peroxiredoxin